MAESTSHKQATEFTIEGETYIAVKDDSGLCNNCAFFCNARCADTPDCTSTRREDGRSIVWIKKPEEN